MAPPVPSIRVSAPYENTDQAIVDAILEQVYYRGTGLVPTHIGVQSTFAAAQWLSTNGRGGCITWIVPGRVFVWTGISTAPGFGDAEKMSAVFAGSGLAQLNTAVSRFGLLVSRVSQRLHLVPGSTP